MDIEVTITVKVTHPRGTITVHGITEKWAYGDNPRFALAATRECIDQTAGELRRSLPGYAGGNEQLNGEVGYPRRYGSVGQQGTDNIVGYS